MIRIVRASFLYTLAACLLVGTLQAASYFPMSDADLVATAGIAVRAEVIGVETRMELDGERRLPETVATLRSIEVFKGTVERTFKVAVPGGRVDDLTWWVPGAPAFEVGAHVLLMLNPLPGRVGEYGLTEFGLSKFDLVSDATGRSFLVRPVFSPREDLLVSKNEYPLAPQSLETTSYAARDAESFFSALRLVVVGARLEPLAYVLPSGDFRPVGSFLKQKWVNLGGRELGVCQGQSGPEPCMARWYFDTTDADVFVTGTQTRLVSAYPSCGVDQSCLIGAAANNWHDIANTDIRISQPMPTGNFEIQLELESGPGWTTPYACNQQGVVGVGGPQFESPAKIFKGLSPYYTCTQATVRMRKWSCDYPSDVFVEVLTHEMGHALGLNHPDATTGSVSAPSVFSTTTPAQWDAALMRSQAHNPSVTTPQADDIQAMQFYYGTAPLGTPTTANFTSQVAGSSASFTDTSTGGPTGWLWFFGDPSSGTDNNFSRLQNPTHAYTAPGTYTVDLIAGNFNGGSRVSKQVTATGGGPSSCVANATTLCLSAGRFKVTATFQRPNDTVRTANAVPLTGNTGYFWFFDNTNVEVVTKVLPFCANPFNSIWVFAAGLTNVKVDITYLDTKTGTTVVKSNPQGTAFVAVQDTAAFQTCP